jgi:hypothetical protein
MEILVITIALVSWLILWVLSKMFPYEPPSRFHRPPEHPPGWRNIKRKTRD